MIGYFGLDSNLWVSYQRVNQMMVDYNELAYLHHEPLDTSKVLDDTLEKWKFLVRWTSFLSSKIVSQLKTHESYQIVRTLALEDEPLCLEALLYGKFNNACRACPLYMINRLGCIQKGNVKEVVVRPLKENVGIFTPFNMVRILNQIRRGGPITKVEGMKIW